MLRTTATTATTASPSLALHSRSLARLHGTRRRALTGLGLCLLSGLAGAQAFGSGPERLLAWPDTGPAADFGLALAGDFDADLRTDLLQLDADRALLALGAATQGDFVRLSQHVSSMAVLSSAGQEDRILLATDTGLSLISWDATSSAFGAQSLAGAAWIDARQLRVADGHLFGLSADGQSLLVARDFESAGSLPVSVALAGVAQELVTLDWSGSADSELGVLDSNGVHLFDSNGQWLQSLALPNFGGFLVPFRQAGNSSARLACVLTLNQADEQWLIAVDSASGAESAVYLGAAHFHAGAAGQLDDSTFTDEDLVLFGSAELSALCLANQSAGAASGSGQSFDLAHTQWMPLVESADPSVDASLFSGHPVLTDLDRDGDLDLAVGLEYLESGTPVEELAICYGARIDAQAQRVMLPQMHAGTTNMHFVPEDENLPAAQWTWELGMHAKVPAQSPLNLDRIEVRTWREIPDASRVLVMNGAVVHSELVDIAQTVDLAIPTAAEATGLLDEVLWIELRFVGLDAQGVLLDAGPSRLLAFAATEEWLTSYVELLPLTGSVFSVSAPLLPAASGYESDDSGLGAGPTPGLPPRGDASLQWVNP